MKIQIIKPNIANHPSEESQATGQNGNQNSWGILSNLPNQWNLTFIWSHRVKL